MKKLMALAGKAVSYIAEARPALATVLERRGLVTGRVAPTSREMLLSFLCANGSTPPSSKFAGTLFVGYAYVFGYSAPFWAKSRVKTLERSGQRLRGDDAFEVLSTDMWPLILYLRSFQSDDVPVVW